MGTCHGTELKTRKKIEATVREPNIAIYMLRCVELGLNKDMLLEISIGDVYDMFTERMNDQEEYPKKATQEDIDSIFR